jgi:hypothetical protein
MRAEDLATLRAYRRKKASVERKASKGRKLRYTTHAKLQHFMFSVPNQMMAEEDVHTDRELLFASLFQ